MDYAFIHLGIDTPTIEHPVFMTERLASPLHSRGRKPISFQLVLLGYLPLHVVTSELLFELYSVPSLAFGVDSIMSFYHNNLPSPPVPFHGDGLVVSFNTASTSVVPILDGKGIMSHAKR